MEKHWLRLLGPAGAKFIGCGPSEGCSGTPDIPLLAWACGSVRARAARTQTFHPEPARQLDGSHPFRMWLGRLAPSPHAPAACTAGLQAGLRVWWCVAGRWAYRGRCARHGPRTRGPARPGVGVGPWSGHRVGLRGVVCRHARATEAGAGILLGTSGPCPPVAAICLVHWPCRQRSDGHCFWSRTA